MAGIRNALIIGGGIAGPVAALALRRAGIAATVCEAYPTPARGIGAVLSLAPNGLDALQAVGALEAVRAVGQPISRMVFADQRGRTVAEFTGLPGLPPSLLLWRSELCRALHGCAEAAGIPIEHGRQLVGAEETKDGITAHFADGSRESADVLIGADGIRSRVRTLIDPQAPGPQYVGLLGFGGRASVPEAATAAPGSMHFVFGQRAFLGHWLSPDGRAMWFGNLPHDRPMTMAEARAVPAAHWLKVLREVYADDMPGRWLLERTRDDDLLVVGAGEILPSVPHWHRGRMVLVGDAAHAPSSSSGQGASLAAESAVQLARCLRDLPDVPAALAAYERLRRPRVEKIAATAARANQRKAAGPVARALGRLLMPVAMKTVLTPARMFGWQHGHRIDWDDVVAA